MQQPPSNQTARQREHIASYPDQPRIEPDSRRVTVSHDGEVIADSSRAMRVLQRGLPPTWYIPPEDVRVELLTASEHQTHCPYKGDAHHYDIVVGDSRAESAAWCYPEPKEAFGAIQHAIAFYPHRVDTCEVDGERARIIPGDTSGGWVTSEIDGV